LLCSLLLFEQYCYCTVHRHFAALTASCSWRPDCDQIIGNSLPGCWQVNGVDWRSHAGTPVHLERVQTTVTEWR